jgi:putative membrane protein
MDTLSKILVGLVGLEHVYILYLEMFLWTTPRAMKSFGTTQEFANESKSLAANQGLYNGFLAAGLFWSVIYPDPVIGRQISLFFLACVIVAAIYGSITAKRSILYIQGAPALVALIVTIVAVAAK